MRTSTAAFSNFIAASALVILLTASFPAAATEKGWYLGFLVGESKVVDVEELSALCDTIFIVCGDKETDTAFQAIVGYQFTNYFGIEGAYFDLGSPGISVTAPVFAQANASMTGGAFSLLPQIPIGSIGALYGRIGIAIGDIEVSAQAPDLGQAATASVTAGTITFGAGGAINLGRRATIRVEWTRYAFDETVALAEIDIITPDVDVIGASLIFRFPRGE